MSKASDLYPSSTRRFILWVFLMPMWGCTQALTYFIDTKKISLWHQLSGCHFEYSSIGLYFIWIDQCLAQGEREKQSGYFSHEQVKKGCRSLTIYDLHATSQYFHLMILSLSWINSFPKYTLARSITPCSPSRLCSVGHQCAPKLYQILLLLKYNPAGREFLDMAVVIKAVVHEVVV